MRGNYPEEPAGEFPEPPREIVDDEGRDVGIRAMAEDDPESLVEMYLEFSPEDRAQGIPPVGADDIREWLGNVRASDCYNVLARHGSLVGHAMLVGDGTGGYELAIFVLQAYQGSRIGTELVRTVLGMAQADGVERVWLTVERWNEPAIRLYETIGFERTGSENFELEMAIRLRC